MSALDVLMPVRDGRFLGPALDSLLAQSHRDFRLVIVEDSAGADTHARLAAISDPRVEVVRVPRSEGLAATLNFGLSLCTAPLVARADADDVYHPERLVRQAAAFAARPELGVLSCNARFIDAHGRSIGSFRRPVGADLVRFHMLLSNPILHPGVMMRRDVIEAVGGYDPAYWTAQDSDLWARLSGRTVIDNLADVLVDWRRHGTSVVATRGLEGERLSATVPLRLQIAYLGQHLDADDVRAGINAFRSWEILPPDMLRRGTEHLARLLAHAETREGPHVLRHLRHLVARGFGRQATWLLRDRPREAVWLTGLSARWLAGGGVR